jgi:hypothetical protein
MFGIEKELRNGYSVIIEDEPLFCYFDLEYGKS